MVSLLFALHSGNKTKDLLCDNGAENHLQPLIAENSNSRVLNKPREIIYTKDNCSAVLQMPGFHSIIPSNRRIFHMTIAETIYKLREKHHLSQEEFANLFHVSHQAVQKWENAATQPSFANIIAIAKHFRISMDSLFLQGDIKPLSSVREMPDIEPDYTGRDNYENYPNNLLLEYKQCLEEGRDLTPYQDLFTAVFSMPEGKYKEQLADICFHIAMNAPTLPDYPYTEPSHYEEIVRYTVPFALKGTCPDRELLKDKIRGAWYGRICGCLLGKPVEGMRTDQLVPLLKATGNYPMHRYIRNCDISGETCDRIKAGLRERCWADTVSCAPVDDDTNYTVLSQVLIDRFGRDFTSDDVGTIWLSCQPKRAYCTAERVTYINLVNGYRPPNTAVYKNSAREWIGAQIRGDYYGYINPGNPALAAEMAFRDASVSHVKNGIYGEMFVSAMIAAAAVTDSIQDIIQAGLSQIPSTCRLYEAVTGILTGYKNGVSCEECFSCIHEKYDEHDRHDWCHTIPNAMIVAASLLYGGGDYTRSI